MYPWHMCVSSAIIARPSTRPSVPMSSPASEKCWNPLFRSKKPTYNILLWANERELINWNITWQSICIPWGVQNAPLIFFWIIPDYSWFFLILPDYSYRLQGHYYSDYCRLFLFFFDYSNYSHYYQTMLTTYQHWNYCMLVLPLTGATSANQVVIIWVK